MMVSDTSGMMAVRIIAKVAHEVNRAYCEALGDDSQRCWSDAPEWQRQSALKGVEFHLTGEHGPEESHESWLREKIATGWVWGREKNEDLKEHPCCVPFSELPREQKAKDFIFRGVVHAMKGLL